MEDFQGLAASDPDFDEALDWATRNQRVASIRIDDIDAFETSSREQAADHGTLAPESELFFVPVKCHADAKLVICLDHKVTSQTDTPALKQQLSLLATLADLRMETAKTEASQAEVAEATQRELKIRQRNNTLQDALTVGNSASLSLEKEKSGFLLANSLQSYLDVDRVTVIEQTGTQMRTLAVSGQVTFNRRANVVRCTEQLAEVVLKSGEGLWFDGDQEELAGPVKEAVTKYLDESLVQSFALLPIVESTRPVFASEEESLVELVNPGRTETKTVRGAILVESIQTPIEREQLESRWSEVEPQSSTTLTMQNVTPICFCFR